MIPIIGLILGIVIGLELPYSFSAAYSTYIAVAILAALDSIFGGINALIQKNFDNIIFVTGFFGNAIIAAGLAFIGDKLNIPIYLAAVLVFGGRLFQNFAIMRRYFVESLKHKAEHEEEK
jgi:small basic protein